MTFTLLSSTVEALKMTHGGIVSTCPRKCTKIILCGILSKSEIRATKVWHMFSMTLWDENTSSTVKAVCFDQQIYEKFQTKCTYSLDSFKIKSSRSGNVLEIHIDSNTKVALANHQFQIEANNYKIAQILRGETRGLRYIQLKAKIQMVNDAEIVGRYPEREILLGDI